jgi:hypothetical protein
MDLPAMTSPNTTCLPSKCGVGTVVMKNCEPAQRRGRQSGRFVDRRASLWPTPRTVRVLARIGHGKQEWAVVPPREPLILELFAIDRHSTRSISACKVATLNHEPVPYIHTLANTVHYPNGWLKGEALENGTRIETDSLTLE